MHADTDQGLVSEPTLDPYYQEGHPTLSAMILALADTMDTLILCEFQAYIDGEPDWSKWACPQCRKVIVSDIPPYCACEAHDPQKAVADAEVVKAALPPKLRALIDALFVLDKPSGADGEDPRELIHPRMGAADRAYAAYLESVYPGATILIPDIGEIEESEEPEEEEDL